MRDAAAESFERGRISARIGPGRWRSPRSVPPMCSSQTRATAARAGCSPTPSMPSVGLASTRHGCGPRPASATPTRSSPRSLIAAGSLLDRRDVLADGLPALRWLLDRETLDGHLSPTPAGGAGPHDRARGSISSRSRRRRWPTPASAPSPSRATQIWRDGIDRSVGWFLGANDVGVPVGDLERGAAYDGLHPDGVNRNEGAESTLALITTLQHARADVTRGMSAIDGRTACSGPHGGGPARVMGSLFVPGHAFAGGPAGRASGSSPRPRPVRRRGRPQPSTSWSCGSGRPTAISLRCSNVTPLRLVDRVAPDVEMSANRRLLLGATFTQEFAVEGAAVCNPSAVADPDQSGLAPGELRAVLSVRQIGEGHRSSIGFRSLVAGRARRRIDARHEPVHDRRLDRGRRARRERLRGSADRWRRRVHPMGARWPRAVVHRRRADGAAAQARGSAATPAATSATSRRGSSTRAPRAATAYGSRLRPISLSASSPRPSDASRTAWRTPASCGSSTMTARSGPTRPTRPTTGRRSPNSS